ncbi:prephenate dehydratase [Falsibacillus pallidus]|uniref:Prephenate dehydratase n=1 Tax=Falsibacillus pallidus TaxID=493781 RepID=A0A370GK96_9BACI|nr:prephenate dehydratase [Falsibacillus pallidus]RDI44135.1 prephenate dehydratase [Falsibacillus pallidus]
MRIGFLGPMATFTDMAVKHLFPLQEHVPFMTIPECIEAVHFEKVDYAVVPLENTLEGSVHLTVDYLFHEVELKIIAELTVPIQQHLMVHPDHVENSMEVEKILSHSHATAQCHQYLHRHYRGASIEYTTSTAAAAKYLKEHPEMKIAAIANELAADTYGLSIIQHGIQDFDRNHTRFVVLSRTKKPLELESGFSNEKTTLMVTLPSNHSGALHQVLSALAWRKINLSKIESRPLKTGLGDYFFILDIEQAMDEVLLPNAIKEMEALGCGVKLLGSYPVYSTE